MLPRQVLQLLASDGYRPEHPAARGAKCEVDYTGLHIRVMSAPKARAYVPGGGEIVISIRSPGEPVLPLSPQFDAVLRLVFSDVGEFAPLSAGDVEVRATITAAQADQLAAFVRAHPDATVLVLHCAAGVSRSRSAAAAICTALDLPYRFSVVNDDVYYTVLRAFAARV